MEFGWSLNFKCPNTSCRRLFSCGWQILRKAICIEPRLPFSGQRLMHRLQSTTIFPKMLRLKYKLRNFDEIYVNPSFHQFIFTLNLKSMPTPHLRDMVIQTLHINRQKYWLRKYPALRRRCYTRCQKHPKFILSPWKKFINTAVSVAKYFFFLLFSPFCHFLIFLTAPLKSSLSLIDSIKYLDMYNLVSLSILPKVLDCCLLKKSPIWLFLPVLEIPDGSFEVSNWFHELTCEDAGTLQVSTVT